MALLFRRPLPINKITITPKALKRQMSVAMSGKPLVFVDFDQTVTTEETTPLLGQWALDTNKIPLSWSFFVDSYMQDYREIKERLPEGLSEEETFDALRPAEEKSLARIRDHGVFKDLSRDMVFKQASQVRAKYIQADALDALGRVPLETLSILSVNWSKDWILGFLEPAGVSRDNIKCNDLVLDDRGKTTGEITTDILTASDKWRKVQQLLPQDKFPFIYIGDSFGDLLPLVNADIGIIIGENGRLLDAIRNKFGITIHEGIPDLTNTPTPVLCRVDSWKQIIDSGVLVQ